jgi:hypothetical protein
LLIQSLAKDPRKKFAMIVTVCPCALTPILGTSLAKPNPWRNITSNKKIFSKSHKQVLIARLLIGKDGCKELNPCQGLQIPCQGSKILAKDLAKDFQNLLLYFVNPSST